MNPDSVTRGIARVLRSMGYKERQSKIMAVLLTSERPLSLREISDLTEYSISSVSMSLDTLEREGLIEKFRKGRELLVVSEKDLRFILQKFLKGLKNELEKLEYELKKEFHRIKERGMEEKFSRAIKIVSEGRELLE